jgi:multiple sugar transport system permease protein
MRSYSSPRRNFRHELRLLLAPYILGSLLLIGLPALLAFGLAFTEYDARAMPRWNGLENFRLVFAEPLFWIALRNSLYLIILATPLRVGAALALALLLWRQRRGVGFFRTAIYVPTAIPEAAYALIWLWIVNPLYGPLNLALRGMGLPAPAWLVDPATARLVFVMMAGFQIGEGLAIMIAALRAIPPQSLEAAAIDGAGTWGRFRSIILPLLTRPGSCCSAFVTFC